MFIKLVVLLLYGHGIDLHADYEVSCPEYQNILIDFRDVL